MQEPTNYRLHTESGDKVVPLGTEKNPSKKVLTGANAITAGRMALGFYGNRRIREGRYWSGGAMVVGAFALDTVDGYVAKKGWLGGASIWGQILDATADRILAVDTSRSLAQTQAAPTSYVQAMIAREALTVGTTTIGAKVFGKEAVKPIEAGRWAFVSTGVTMAGYLTSKAMEESYPVASENLRSATNVAAIGSLAFSYGVTGVYFKRGIDYLLDQRNTEPAEVFALEDYTHPAANEETI